MGSLTGSSYTDIPNADDRKRKTSGSQYTLVEHAVTQTDSQSVQQRKRE